MVLDEILQEKVIPLSCLSWMPVTSFGPGTVPDFAVFSGRYSFIALRLLEE